MANNWNRVAAPSTNGNGQGNGGGSTSFEARYEAIREDLEDIKQDMAAFGVDTGLSPADADRVAEVAIKAVARTRAHSPTR